MTRHGPPDPGEADPDVITISHEASNSDIEAASATLVWFRLVVVAVCLMISAVGDEVAGIALALRSHESGWPGWVTGCIMACSVAPMLVFSKWIAKIVDRFELRTLLIWLMVAEGVIAVSLSSVDRIAPTIGVALALGTFGAIASAASFVLLPEVVHKRHLATATGLLVAVSGGAALLGPALGGLLVAADGVQTALQINGASFLVAAAGYAVLRGRRYPVPAVAGDTRSGFQVLWANATLRRILPLFYLGVFSSVLMNAARLYFTIDVLGASSAAYGLSSAAPPAGLVLGGFIAGWCHNRFGTRMCGAAGFAVMGAAVIAAAMTRSLALVVVAFVFVGIGNVVCNVAVKMSLISELPPALRARGAATYGALLAAAFTPGVILGGVFGASAPAATLIAAGVLTFGAGVGMSIWAPPTDRTARTGDEVGSPAHLTPSAATSSPGQAHPTIAGES